MKKNLQIIGLLIAGLSCSSIYAENLMQVYQQAVKNDPIFAQAQSTWESQKMNLPIAEAGYLPQVGLTANLSRNYFQLSPNLGSGATSIFNGILGGGGAQNYSWQYGYQLTASQPIFNLAAWTQIKGASASVKSATATYLAAQQSLMQRTATAYFNVLEAADRLRYTIANKNAVWQQYVTAREQFRVGLIAITDEYNARARYDQVVAQQITAQNNLNIQLENLRAITNHAYRSLQTLVHFPLLTPKPNNIDTWVHIANHQNYSIKAQSYAVLAAMQTIRQRASGDMPTLGLQGSLGELHAVDTSPNQVNDTASLGLALSYQPIQGGLVNASTKQARYDYVTASGLLVQVHRQVVNQTRTSFLSVLSDMSQIKADRLTIVSTRNSLAATEAGMQVGTRSMTDVLNALTAVYQAQQQYAVDEYNYIDNLIALKAAAGTLSVSDLEVINSWLGKSTIFPNPLSVGAVPTEKQNKPVSNDHQYPDQYRSTNPHEGVAPIKIDTNMLSIQKNVVANPSPIQLAPPRQTRIVLPPP